LADELRFKVNAPKVLPNGAKVLDYKIYANGNIVALCEFGVGYHPFVTWRLDEEGNAFWGHYFDNAEEAYRDFEERR
jgi:hypothetical protein